VAELGFGKKFEDGGGHEMGGGMAIDFEGLGIAVGEDAEVGVFDRAGE
jgi:hypothetical protein